MGHTLPAVFEAGPLLPYGALWVRALSVLALVRFAHFFLCSSIFFCVVRIIVFVLWFLCSRPRAVLVATRF